MPSQAPHHHFSPLGARLRKLLDKFAAQQEPVTTSALPTPRQRSLGRLKRSASRPELEDGAEYAFPTAASDYELREVVGQGSTSRVRLPTHLLHSKAGRCWRLPAAGAQCEQHAVRIRGGGAALHGPCL